MNQPGKCVGKECMNTERSVTKPRYFYRNLNCRPLDMALSPFISGRWFADGTSIDLAPYIANPSGIPEKERALP
jgi:hypothetical protein